MPGVWLSLPAMRPVGRFAARAIVAVEAELALLAVRSSAPSPGVGKMLLHSFSGEAKTLGANRLHLKYARESTPLSLTIGRPILQSRRRNSTGGGMTSIRRLDLAKDVDGAN